MSFAACFAPSSVLLPRRAHAALTSLNSSHLYRQCHPPLRRLRHPQHASPSRIYPAATATPTPSSSSMQSIRKAAHQVFSLGLLISIQQAASYLLKTQKIVFPPPLAAMLFLLVLITSLRTVGQSKFVDRSNNVLFNPGLSFLTRWLAVFFVPNLVMLPLAPPLPRADLLKISILLVLGFFFTLFSTAIVCSTLRFITRKLSNRSSSPKIIVASSTSNSPPSSRLIATLCFTACISLFGAYFSGVNSLAARLYALAATLLTFTIGCRLPSRVKTLLHPLVTCTLGTIGMMHVLSLVTNVPFATALGGYYTRGPLRMWGGGDILAALLGPAVITFAFIMDGQRRVARSRGVEVLGSCAFSATAALLGSAWVCRMAGLSTMGRLVMVPRTVTAPLAVGIAQMIGADVGIAASVVAITGLIGANIGAAVLSVAGVKDGVVRGLSIGSAAHGLGTAAVSEENDTFPFAALAMTLVGVFSTLLVAFGPFRTLLIRTAIGSVVGAKVK